MTDHFMLLNLHVVLARMMPLMARDTHLVPSAIVAAAAAATWRLRSSMKRFKIIVLDSFNVDRQVA